MLFKGMTQKKVNVIKLPVNMHIRKLNICRCVDAVSVHVGVNDAFGTKGSKVALAVL